MIYVRTLLRVIGIAFALVSCVEEFDTTRRPHREASVGDNVYEVLCNRLASRENPHDVSGRSTRALCQGTGTPGAGTSVRLKVLHNNRARLVQALDATLGLEATGLGATPSDPNLASDVRTLLDQMLPLYDNGLMESHNAALGGWMQQLRNTSVNEALAAQSTRQWYNQSVVQNANHEFVVPTAALPIMMRFNQLTDLGAGFDKAFGEGTPNAKIFANWLASAQASLRAYTPQGASGFLLNYVLRADDALNGATQPLYSVLRDQHGNAEVVDTAAEVTPASLQTAPFGDANSGWSGLYTRDAYGRLQSDGQLLYAYQDLNKTPLAATLRQTKLWMDKLADQKVGGSNPQLATLASTTSTHGGPNLLDGLTWLDAVLQSDEGLPIDTNKLSDQSSGSAVVDAAGATGWTFQQEAVNALVPILRMLWDENQVEVAKTIQLFSAMSKRMDQNDLVDTKLAPANTMIDDLIDVAQKMATHPGLLERIVIALKDPETAKLGPLFAEHMTTVDSIDYDPTDFRSSIAVGQFVTPVDRTRGDVLGNESVFQRLMYLVHDAYGLRIINNEEIFGYAPGELFQIDDAALFYLRSIIGKARMTICSRQGEQAFFDTGNQPYIDSEHNMVMPSAELYGYQYFIEYAMGLSGLVPVPPSQAEKTQCALAINPDDEDEHVAYTYSITPQAAARMLFIDPEALQVWSNAQAEHFDTAAFGVGYPPSKMYDEPIIDGAPFRQLHGKTLFAWEKGGFHQAIAPLLEAFAEPDPGAQEGNEALFLDLMNIMHKHWSTSKSNRTQNQDRAKTNYAAQTGLAQFEPLIAFALDDPNHTDANNNAGCGALDRVASLVRIFYEDEDEMDQDTFLTPVSPLSGTMAAMLGVRQDVDLPANNPYVDPGTLLGRPNPVLRMSDGITPIAHPAPAHVLNHLVHHVAVQTDHLSQERPGVGAVFGALLDTFSEIDEKEKRLANRETHALVSGLLRYMVDHLSDVGEHLQGDTKALVSSPLLSATLELMTTFNRVDPNAGALVQALVTHMVSDEQRPALLSVAARTLYTAADSQVDLRPLAQATADAMDYPNGALPLTLKLASATRDVDSRNALPRVVANLGRALPSPNNASQMSETPIDIFIDVYQQINRVSPTDTSSLSASDHAAIIDSLADFVQDDKRGFVRLLELIKHRHGN